MDDSCAVCAETLEWVAYGSCGHKDVCSTCVARLRFICDDRRCCICKSESPVIFITKALGDYTRVINDFSVLPSGAKEGRAGSYWYHEDTQAFFDDSDHYKMIKAMCRLSCSVCDKLEDQGNDGPKRRAKFRNIDQLKGHLFHQHRLLMCSLCLEGRKVFICEQKLYSKAQLKQHINTGDSEVDGTGSERGGFMGHPLCEFCRSPFYGDNELYMHMSTEHYTCHICQRQHPGQYEYYKNYEDLEIHFRNEHFLCEDQSCLNKKFTVFQTEAEMKRHNALEHGGRMSRAQRNAALQIPTSFRYRRSNEQDNRRGRGRTFQRDVSDAELSRAIEASFETASLDNSFQDSLSSNLPVISEGQTSDINPIIQPFESIATTDFEPPSRYLQALSHVSMNRRLEESSFPPLPLAPGSSQQRPMSDQEGLQKNTMAENLRGKNKKKVTVLNPVQRDSAQAWPVASRVHVAQAATPAHSRPNVNNNPGFSLMSAQNKPAINQTQSRYSSSVQSQHASVNELFSAGTLTSLSNWGSTNRISHSTSAPNLAEVGSTSDFPPVSVAQTRKQPVSRQAVQKVEDVYTTNNKSMVEKIRAALEFDQDKYVTFKDISGEYRQGLIDAETYLAHVEQFRLSHLILDLARLCPDPQKERELIAAYNATRVNRGSQENGWPSGTKGKNIVAENSSSKDNLADSILSKVRELQSNYKQPEVEVETLSKEGYRAAKGKLKVGVDGPRAELNSPTLTVLKAKGENDFRFDGGGSDQNSGDGDGRSKHRKKTSKFNRVRLGDGSLAALRDPNPSLDPGPESVKSASDGNKDTEGLPVRGVWKNGGGHKLLAMTSKRP